MSIFIIDQNHTCGKNEKTRVEMSFRVISYICIIGKHYIFALHFLKPFPSTPTPPQEVWVRDDPTGKTFFVKGFIQVLNRDIYLYDKNTAEHCSLKDNKWIWVSAMKTEIWRSWENLITVCYQWIKNPFTIKTARNGENLLFIRSSLQLLTLWNKIKKKKTETDVLFCKLSVKYNPFRGGQWDGVNGIN